MNIPNLPNRSLPIIDSENPENMHPLWHNFFDQLLTQLQQNVSQEGISIPQQTTSNITALQAGSSIPTFVYNQEDHKVLAKINGVFKEILTT